MKSNQSAPAFLRVEATSHLIRTAFGLCLLVSGSGAAPVFVAVILATCSLFFLYFVFLYMARGWRSWSWLPTIEVLGGLWLVYNFGPLGFGEDLIVAGWELTGAETEFPSWSSLVGADLVILEVLSWWPLTVVVSLLLTSFLFRVLQRLQQAPKDRVTDKAPQPQIQSPLARMPKAPQESKVTLMFPARRPKHAFDAVEGMNILKGNLLKTVKVFAEDGGNGILLSGDPGNGKTFMAEALAGEIGFNFLEARTSELTSRWMGAGAEKITRIFADARAQAPVVLFLDEFDSFMGDRASMNSGGVAGQDNLVNANTFLTAIADMNKGLLQHRVLIVAATNFRDNLDEGGVREGRFDAKVEVPPPDIEARQALLMTHLRPYVQRMNLESVKSILRRWEDWSATRILAISKGAARKLKEDASLQIDAPLLRSVIDDLAAGSGTRLSESTLGLDQLQFPSALRADLDVLVKKLKHPELVEMAGGAVPRGAVFYGPSGTGKTAAAQALAMETGWRFLATSSPDLLAAPDKIDKLVKKARDIRPCIIFIDEAEGVLASRESNRNPYAKEVTNKLLSVIDGPRKLHDVFFVAATNFAQDLDAAMVRMGRLSEHFDFTPDEQSLCDVVQAFMRSRPQVRWEGEPADFVARHPRLGPSEIKGLLLKAISKASVHSIGLQSVGAGKKAPGVVVDLREI